MRLATISAFAVFAIGAALTWVTDWSVVGADGELIGPILMIAAGVGLIALIVVSARNPASGTGGGVENEPLDEPVDRLSAGREGRRCCRVAEPAELSQDQAAQRLVRTHSLRRLAVFAVTFSPQRAGAGSLNRRSTLRVREGRLS
jgi:hypothetical protein